MKTTFALVLGLLLGGCPLYFGGGDDGPPYVPPDAYILHDSRPGPCSSEAPPNGESCSFHQSGMVCTYPATTGPYVICRCDFDKMGPGHIWECAEARFDAGVDAP